MNESTKLNIAILTARFPDRHFLHEDILYGLKDELEIGGYLGTINKPYYDYLNAFDEEIKTTQQPAHYWNNKGIVYGCLEGMEEIKYTLKKFGDESAVDCYNKAIEIYPDLAEA